MDRATAEAVAIELAERGLLYWGPRWWMPTELGEQLIIRIEENS